MKKKEANTTSEPYFYIAIVLKGTEKQYLNLMKYINGRNRARIIYQCRSLGYLRVIRDDGVKLRAATPDLAFEAKQSRGESE